MEIVEISTEYIKLEQFLKWAGLVDTGSDAKELILQGLVRVNGDVELQRGKKLRKGDTVELGGNKMQVG